MAASVPGLGLHGQRALQRMLAAELRERSQAPAMDLALGVDVHVESVALGLVTLAKAVNFVRDGVLDPHAGLARLLPAWGTALGNEADFSATAVYFALLENLHRDRDATGAESVHVMIGGVSMDWTAFTIKSTADWRLGTRTATKPQLVAFVRTLRAFGEGCNLVNDPLPAHAFAVFTQACGYGRASALRGQQAALAGRGGAVAPTLPQSSPGPSGPPEGELEA